MKILLPIDGSELALHEVRFAIRLAQEGLQASFVLVNVQEPASLYEIVTAPDPKVLDEVSLAAGKHAVRPAQALLKHAGLESEAVIVHGDPVQAVLEQVEAYGCDMIVTGTRNAGLLRTALQGSVSQAIAHDSPVPVLLVKPPLAEDPLPPKDEADDAADDDNAAADATSPSA